jgi:thiamine monophosphate synthase
MRLLAITPPAAVQPRIDLAVVDAWLDAGAGALGLAVLVREPGASLAATLGDPRFGGLREQLAARGIPAWVSIDSRPDPALVAQLLAARPMLAGVQLRGDPSPAERHWWRATLGPEWVIGRSCHGPAPASALELALDYTCVAPIFAPGTAQPGVEKRAIGIPALRRWTATVPRVFALGGIEPATAAECLAAGASGLAGISLFFAPPARARDNVAALGSVFASATGPGLQAHVPQARRRG